MNAYAANDDDWSISWLPVMALTGCIAHHYGNHIPVVMIRIKQAQYFHMTAAELHKCTRDSDAQMEKTLNAPFLEMLVGYNKNSIKSCHSAALVAIIIQMYAFVVIHFGLHSAFSSFPTSTWKKNKKKNGFRLFNAGR